MRKPCIKCLLQDFDEAGYIEKIKKELDWMDEELRSPEELYRKRLDVCLSCEKLHEGTCLACGCYVELRAAIRKGKCPYKKW
ncbi:MAG: hypothetical protein IK115_06125 [Lachnospiraceae bacterium]|nr:hypothetical protein [Lachnospiraceae bacterium]